MSKRPEQKQATIDEVIDSNAKVVGVAEISGEVAELAELCGSYIDAAIEVFAKYDIQFEDATSYLTPHLISKIAKEATDINMVNGVVTDAFAAFKPRS